ncbi:MAG: hypothetical protein AAF447_23485, partial [Myxococcota bacterium]
AGSHRRRVAFLVGFRNRIRVLLSWSFSWLLNSHDARVIVDGARLEVTRPHGPGFTPTEAAETPVGPSSA